MPVPAAPLNAPIVLSRRDSSELAQKTRQPIQNISLLSPPMMSGMSRFEHVSMLNKMGALWPELVLRQSSPQWA